VRITGITNETLRDKKRFEHPDVVDRLMEFLGDDPIVAHNAEFDRGFLNYELELLGRPQLPKERFIDTLVLAREHRPGLAGVARCGMQAVQHFDRGQGVARGAAGRAALGNGVSGTARRA
jgi:DNA polymerase III epsilon subunit-like protein